MCIHIKFEDSSLIQQVFRILTNSQLVLPIILFFTAVSVVYLECRFGFDSVFNFVLFLGVEMGGGCGEASIRFRPSLTFSPHHANILLDVMDNVASQMLSQ